MADTFEITDTLRGGLRLSSKNGRERTQRGRTSKRSAVAANSHFFSPHGGPREQETRTFSRLFSLLFSSLRYYRFHRTPLLRAATGDCQGISRELAAGSDSSSFRSVAADRPSPVDTRRGRHRRGWRGGPAISCYFLTKADRKAVCATWDFVGYPTSARGILRRQRLCPSLSHSLSLSVAPLASLARLSINFLSRASSFCGGHLWLWDEGRMCNELLV